jgi:hypothetical protein
MKKTEEHNCCTPQSKIKKLCPLCNTEAKSVLSKTVKNLAKTELNSFSDFYYCEVSSCKAIYFKNDIILKQEEISVTVGLKDGANPPILCYCFGWDRDMIEDELKKSGTTNALDDIKNKMNSIGCSCEILNPSGRCCLKSISKAIKEIKAKQ